MKRAFKILFVMEIVRKLYEKDFKRCVLKMKDIQLSNQQLPKEYKS